MSCELVPFPYEGHFHLLLVVLDITERRQSEQALAESLVRYQSLFNNMFEGYVHCRLITDQGRPVDFIDLAVNPAFEQLTGLKDVVGKRISELLPGIRESNPEMFEVYHRVATTGEPARFQTYVRELSRWFSVAVHRPAPGEFVAVFDNITEQKQAEMTLRRSEALLSHAGRMAHLGTWEIEIVDPEDPASNRLHWSDEVFRIFGLTPGEVTLTSAVFYAALPPEDRERVASTMRNALATGAPYEVEHRIWRRDGTECVVLENAEIRCDAAGKPCQIIGAVQDITDHKRAEAEIRTLNQDLERRVRERTAELEASNRELEAFSYSVSHDLRAPLRTMDGFALALLEDYAPLLPEAGRRFAEKIRQGAQRMGCLINDLLAFSRIVNIPLNRETVLTERLVHEALDELYLQDRARQTELDVRELPDCSGDSKLLKQVWLNLLSNAFKYTRPREQARIEVGSRQEPDGPVYYVRDNGVGFDMRHAHHLFGVFQRLHRADQFEGTGVGLAIVHRILERHGGRIWVEAAVDQGATFYFQLPEPAPAA